MVLDLWAREDTRGEMCNAGYFSICVNLVHDASGISFSDFQIVGRYFAVSVEQICSYSFWTLHANPCDFWICVRRSGGCVMDNQRAGEVYKNDHQAAVVGVREARARLLVYTCHAPSSHSAGKRANTLSTLPPEFGLPPRTVIVSECTFIVPVTLTQWPTSQHGDSGFLSSVLSTPSSRNPNDGKSRLVHPLHAVTALYMELFHHV